MIAGLALVFGPNLDSVGVQTVPKTYPKSVDLGVDGVYLSFRKSTEDILGSSLSMTSSEGRPAQVVCLNKSGDQALTLSHHAGKEINTFQEFDVRKLQGDIKADCRLRDIESFVSARGVKLGMSVKEITQIFGSDFKVESSAGSFDIRYVLDSNVHSSFLRYYKENYYYGRYSFKAGKLVRFSFGFDPRY